jgi:hypothetical protein
VLGSSPVGPSGAGLVPVSDTTPSGAAVVEAEAEDGAVVKLGALGGGLELPAGGVGVAQAKTLHGAVSVSPAQSAASESATTSRCLVLVPVPQSVEQASQSSQGESTHSAGQSCVLQLSSSTSESSSTSQDPPFSAGRMPRVLVRKPPPQVCVQFDQALQPRTLQSTGGNVVGSVAGGAVFGLGPMGSGLVPAASLFAPGTAVVEDNEAMGVG